MKLLSFLPRTAALATVLAAATPLLAPAVATAEPAPAAKRFIDEATWSLSLGNSGTGYSLTLKAWLSGVTSPSDAIRVELVQKGKVLGGKRCAITPAEGDKIGWIECSTHSEKLFTATGDVELRLIYIDDQSETEEVIRTFKSKVVAYEDIGEIEYGLLGDDLIGPGYVYHKRTRDSRDDLTPEFYFWMATYPRASAYQLRCTIEGKRVPDLDTYVGSENRTSFGVRTGGEITEYGWSRVGVVPRKAHWGTREEVTAAHTGGAQNDFVFGEHPGAWSCDLRADGKVLRTLKFEVGVDGKVAAHPSQAAEGAPTLWPGVGMIDVYLPKEPPDFRVRPDAIRKSHSFGLSWAKNDRTEAFLKSLPAASGPADPKPFKGKKGKK